MPSSSRFRVLHLVLLERQGKEELGSGASKIHASPVRSSRYMECEMVASRSPARADRQFRGIVKLRPPTVLMPSMAGASHDEEQHIKLIRQRLLSSQLE